MIPNPVRQTLAALLLAVHAAASLCGPGHHGLASGFSAATRDAGPQGDRGDAVAAQADGLCPACDYLATPALPFADPPVLAPGLRVEPAPARPSPGRAGLPLLTLARPRAPPASVPA